VAGDDKSTAVASHFDAFDEYFPSADGAINHVFRIRVRLEADREQALNIDKRSVWSHTKCRVPAVRIGPARCDKATAPTGVTAAAIAGIIEYAAAATRRALASRFAFLCLNGAETENYDGERGGYRHQHTLEHGTSRLRVGENSSAIWFEHEGSPPPELH
jgi:hypothetical protein